MMYGALFDEEHPDTEHEQNRRVDGETFQPTDDQASLSRRDCRANQCGCRNEHGRDQRPRDHASSVRGNHRHSRHHAARGHEQIEGRRMREAFHFGVMR